MALPRGKLLVQHGPALLHDFLGGNLVAAYGGHNALGGARETAARADALR